MAQTGESVVVPDTTASPDWIPGGDREWRRSYVGAPIQVANAVVGFLNVNGTQAGQFGPADAERLSIFANYAATAIENARLVESLEDQVVARTAEIRAEQEKSETILRSVGDAITMADLQMRIQYVNDAFTALTGYTAEEVLGKQVSQVGAVVKSEQARRSLWSDLAQGKSWQGEAIGYRKDGRTYDAELTIAPVLDADGSLVGCVSSHRDVSQQKELDRARSRFMTHVSHELRTPVTNIKLYTQLLQRGLSPEKTERHLRVLGEQVDRLGHLVEDILEMTALDSGQTVVARNMISLPTIIQDTLVRFQDRARAAGLSLVSQPLPSNLPAVTGDQVWLGRALSKLVDNAVTYAPMQDRDGGLAPSGRPVNIEVGTAEQDGQTWVTIAVQDAGPGISAEEQEQVLDRFFRGSLAESGHVPGTGLGLSIVQEILRAHGGRVTVESKAGVGSTFTLWLPGGHNESRDGLDSAGAG
jgi:PAS domain S-box-containing protein